MSVAALGEIFLVVHGRAVKGCMPVGMGGPADVQFVVEIFLGGGLTELLQALDTKATEYEVTPVLAVLRGK